MKKLLAIVLGVALAGVGTVALASRNASGTYNLPAGNPVVGGTKITSSWANTTLGDISAELTDSLSRTGKGGMSAHLRVPNGTAGAPTLSFTNDTDAGWYLSSAGNVHLAVGATDSLRCTATGVTVPGTLGVTGASTLTGNTTVGGTLGVTGVATFTATPVLSAGASVPGGNIAFTAVGTQELVKSGGLLVLGTSDANQTQFFYDGNLVGSINGVGFDNANRPINSVATPTNATDAATKGYVDTQIGFNRPTFVVLIDGTSGSVLRVVMGSTTGYVFAKSSAGVYTITKAGGYAANRIVHVSAVSTTGVAASWSPTSGTVTTLYVAGAADATLAVSMFD
jgi:hypothetical protein